MKFTKNAGAGNDFIVINNIEEKYRRHSLRRWPDGCARGACRSVRWHDDRGRAAKRRRLPHVFL